jgi:VWFA-related protein
MQFGAFMSRVKIMLVVALVVALSAPGLFRKGQWLQETAYAQDGSGTRRPRLPEPQDEGDEPKGKTAISVAVDLVSLQVLVTDDKGSAITGLKPANFTIYEDNVKQEISHFAPVEGNITSVMLVEYSRQVSYFVNEVWNAIYGFAASLRQGDWVAVIGYDMRPTILCDFTQDKATINEALSRFTYPAFSESNLSDALIDTLDRIEEAEGKVAVLLVSTGLDTFSKHTYNEALDKCRQTNASIYAISLGQATRIYAEAAGAISPETNLELLQSDNRLRTFADLTGGAAYFPRFETELPSIFGTISNLLRNQYSIAYSSSNTSHDGKYRKLRVEVSEPGFVDKKGKPVKLKVVTRKGYQAKQS